MPNGEKPVQAFPHPLKQHGYTHIEGVDPIQGLEDAVEKLAGIEADAKDDQTGAEIKALLEALTGANRLVATAIQHLDNLGVTPSAAQWAILGALTTDPIVKAWIQFNGTGTIAIQDSFNVSSIVDDDVGEYIINWDTDFANDDYAAVSSSNQSQHMFSLHTPAVGSIETRCRNAAGDYADASNAFIIAIGDQ